MGSTVKIHKVRGYLDIRALIQRGAMQYVLRKSASSARIWSLSFIKRNGVVRHVLVPSEIALHVVLKYGGIRVEKETIKAKVILRFISEHAVMLIKIIV